MTIAELMTAPPTALLPGESVLTAARTMRERDIGMVPIVRDTVTMRLVGVITEGDIALRCVAERHWGGCAVNRHMTRAPLHTVHPWEEERVAIRIMRSAGVRRLPVVDADGRLVGVVSHTDLAQGAALRSPPALLSIGA